MGWWKESVKGRELLFGDEPMDLVHELVAAVSKSYLDDCGRKPTDDERLKFLHEYFKIPMKKKRK